MNTVKSTVIGFFSMVLVSGLCAAAEKKELKTEAERVNYSVGYQIGGDFKSQGVELDPDALVQGIQDAIKKNKPLMSQDQMNATLVDLKKKIVADQQAAEKKTAVDNRKASAAYLAENARRKGVTVLPSGVQYRVIKEGTGRKPTLKDEVKVHYRMTQMDGKELGNTYVGGKPRTYPLQKAMPGLQEVLQLMAEGSKWEIFLPTSATGGHELLDDKGVLIYEMELISVKTAPDQEK
ncbi:MAG: FKBP-type peptidyl-prolyl cis-trans isomerase N-terminal domain-containing protein [Nitrospirota bacterium]